MLARELIMSSLDRLASNEDYAARPIAEVTALVDQIGNSGLIEVLEILSLAADDALTWPLVPERTREELKCCIMGLAVAITALKEKTIP